MPILLAVLVVPARAGEQTVASSLIPFASLTATNRMLVRGVTDHYTLRRKYPPKPVHARLDQLEYLLDHMEVCSVLAEKLKLIKYRAKLDKHGRLYANDGNGASGFLMNVYAGKGKRIFYVAGTQRGLFTVHGRGVAVIDYHKVKPGLIEYEGTVFVKVDNAFFAALTQLFAVFLKNTVDRHYENVLKHPVILSERALADPNALLDQIADMPPPDRKLLQPFADLIVNDLRTTSVAKAAGKH